MTRSRRRYLRALRSALIAFRAPLLAAVIAFGIFVPAALPAAGPEASVVQITTFKQPPHWDEPWRSGHVRGSTGTGFVIAGKRILTNAQVVSWAKEILDRS